MKLTIYDIARELNLAPSTISKVINNKENVSKKTRQLVSDYIKKVGYVPKNSARMLKSKKSNIIGVVFSEETNIGLEHSFFSSILQHFKTYVEERGYELTFIRTQFGHNNMSYYQWCMNKGVDGVYIVVGDYDDEGIFELANKDIPVVSTDILIDGIKTTISNNKQGIFLSLDHYYKNNVKTVGLIHGPLNSKAFKMRYDAFYEYHKINNLKVNESFVIPARSFGFTSGYDATTQLIKANKVLPEGLIVGSDDIALGVLKALRDNNIKVPEEIQVIGFDDIAFSQYFTPSLTTIRQDKALIAENAAKELLDMIENKEEHKTSIKEMPVSLILRETTIN